MLLYNLAVLFLPFDITGYTQYTYILGNIELFTRAHGKQIEKRKQIIFFIFNANVRILCLSCNIKKSKTPAKLY
jgi:hypothetical protein